MQIDHELTHLRRASFDIWQVVRISSLSEECTSGIEREAGFLEVYINEALKFSNYKCRAGVDGRKIYLKKVYNART